MRLSKVFKLTLLTTALAALAIASAAHAVTTNGKKAPVQVTCAGKPGSTTPGGGADGVYTDPYGNPYGPPYGPAAPYGTPGTNTPGSGCSGVVTLKAGKKKVGAGKFSLQRGQRKPVIVRINRKGRKILAARGRLKVKVAVRGSGGVSAPRKLKLKLKAPKPKK